MLGYGQYTADRRQMVTNRHARAQNGQENTALITIHNLGFHDLAAS